MRTNQQRHSPVFGVDRQTTAVEVAGSLGGASLPVRCVRRAARVAFGVLPFPQQLRLGPPSPTSLPKWVSSKSEIQLKFQDTQSPVIPKTSIELLSRRNPGPFSLLFEKKKVLRMVMGALTVEFGGGGWVPSNLSVAFRREAW
nr:hypothetical protein Iba_chr03dCG8830 [Ipomoea batatas]GMC75853.1 hypothetical protein Iba_chr03dCG8840 [Ipomoea batatas]